MSNFTYIPVSYVYSSDVSALDRETLHEQYLPFVLANRDKKSRDRSSVNTDFFEPDEGAWNLFSTILFPHVVEFLETHLASSGGFGVRFKPCWFNYYAAGTSMSFHSHTDSDFGLVYCLRNEGNKGTLFDVFSNDWATQTARYQKLRPGRHVWVPSAGEFAIFPASLYHASDTAEKDGERITLVANVLVKRFDVGERLSVTLQAP